LNCSWCSLYKEIIKWNSNNSGWKTALSYLLSVYRMMSTMFPFPPKVWNRYILFPECCNLLLTKAVLGVSARWPWTCLTLCCASQLAAEFWSMLNFLSKFHNTHMCSLCLPQNEPTVAPPRHPTLHAFCSLWMWSWCLWSIIVRKKTATCIMEIKESCLTMCCVWLCFYCWDITSCSHKTSDWPVVYVAWLWVIMLKLMVLLQQRKAINGNQW
jgi:hypothetical protein